MNIKLVLKKLLGCLFRPSREDQYYFLRELRPLLKVRDLNGFLATMPFRDWYKTLQIDVPFNQVVVVISPHPDDELFGCGGTLLQMQQKGCSIHVIYVTTGDPEKAEMIHKESEQVCQKMEWTGHYLRFWPKHIPLTASSELEKIVKIIDPDIMFLPFFLDDNNDHKRVNEIITKITSLKDRITVWAYQVYSFAPLNTVVDITAEMEQKSNVCEIYQSVSGARDWVHYIRGANAIMSRYISSKKPAYGECFLVIEFDAYIEVVQEYFRQVKQNCYSIKNYWD